MLCCADGFSGLCEVSRADSNDPDLFNEAKKLLEKNDEPSDELEVDSPVLTGERGTQRYLWTGGLKSSLEGELEDSEAARFAEQKRK